VEGVGGVRRHRLGALGAGHAGLNAAESFSFLGGRP
jgi:hypothetical protein